jgi:glycosyltransferase involved in cell wall biosynthesis
MKIPCTVTVLTLNSGKTLRVCLESVKNCAEILIVDGNSTDDTLAIAKEFGARVEKQYDTTEQNVRAQDFSALRIKSFGLATHPWLFYVDSDEQVSPELINAVERMVQENNPRVAGAFSRKAVIDGQLIEYAFFYPEWCVRLWHRDSGVHFKTNKVVHEQIAVPSTVSVKHLPGIVRAGWPTLQAFKQKQEFYLRLLRTKTETKKEKFGTLMQIKVIFKNTFRACGIFVKIILNLLRHPGSQTLPFSYSWLFVVYHWRIAGIRLAYLLDHREEVK